MCILVENEYNHVYLPFVDATASSSRTLIVPSPLPSSEKGDDDDDIIENDKGKTDDENNTAETHSYKDLKQQPYYHHHHHHHHHYSFPYSVQQTECHQQRHYRRMTNHHPLDKIDNLNKTSTSLTIPIPFSSTFTTMDTSSYPSKSHPMLTQSSSSSSSSSLPHRQHEPSTTISRSTSSCSAFISSQKRVKRWIIATLMIIVGLLIALTFILIGLGKAFSRQQHQPSLPSSSSSSLRQPSVTPITTTITSMTSFT
ncbi:uncharacterized protein BX664DRAFT_372175 [Halteromyces radiatus]|uniref:uncharacterized protein n=1 Tax=Halteromyces radiatus TaxID=101107 RepID=UPI00221F5808|nr:uncharacterized protein BX664DRAFT_372175 [Halteromyces radiatus]KAI8093303.1 hypothetical protein BX664DRAFT_372175 [Halteromyces radiatus]